MIPMAGCVFAHCGRLNLKGNVAQACSVRLSHRPAAESGCGRFYSRAPLAFDSIGHVMKMLRFVAPLAVASFLAILCRPGGRTNSEPDLPPLPRRDAICPGATGSAGSWNKVGRNPRSRAWPRRHSTARAISRSRSPPSTTITLPASGRWRARWRAAHVAAASQSGREFGFRRLARSKRKFFAGAQHR